MIYKKNTDQELLTLITQGDRLAFGEVYERYKGVLFAHAYRRLSNQEEAEDVIHDLFTQLWNKRDALIIQTELSFYLYTAVRNRVFKIISRKKIESEYIASIDTTIVNSHLFTDHKVRERELALVIEREIAALPSKMREVFLLSRNEHLSHKEIADKLDISEKTVSRQISNALKILRTKLGLVLYLAFLLKWR